MTGPEANANPGVARTLGRIVWDHQGVSDTPESSPQEPAHDVLAAEAFAVPTPDPRLRHDLVLPGDPAGIVEPHDILAAEEFAMPAPEPEAEGGRLGPGKGRGQAAKAGLVAILALLLWRRRRARR
jgi:hypothetical protein